MFLKHFVFSIVIMKLEIPSLSWSGNWVFWKVGRKKKQSRQQDRALRYTSVYVPKIRGCNVAKDPGRTLVQEDSDLVAEFQRQVECRKFKRSKWCYTLSKALAMLKLWSSASPEALWCRRIYRLPWHGSPSCFVALAISMVNTTLEFIFYAFHQVQSNHFGTLTHKKWESLTNWTFPLNHHDCKSLCWTH